MLTVSQLRALSFTIITWFGLLVSGCEPWQVITFENHTQVSIKVETRGVPLDFVGSPPSFSYDVDVVPIRAGESKKFGTSVPKGRSTGAERKYTVVVVSESNEVVFSKILTWDELHDMNWTVVIPAPQNK